MMGREVDYRRAPAEDFARASVTYADEQGTPLIVEATTSWSYVGAGLRLTMELLGPEYSMSINSLEGGTKLFFSRRLQGQAGEDLVEKQNAEQGLMPIVNNEYAEYGYEGENRHFTRCFLDGVQPELGFHAGLEVTELLMACYMSAEQERVIAWKPPGLLDYVPPVARRDFPNFAG
jgi:predicted dehydrogenase